MPRTLTISEERAKQTQIAKLRAELTTTREQLAKAREVIRALQSHESAVALRNPEGDGEGLGSRLSENKFAKAFEISPAAIVISRLSDGSVLDLNRACEEMIGCSREELVGKTSDRFWPTPDDRVRWVRQLVEHGSYSNCEQIMLRASGEARVTLSSASKMNVAGEELVLSTWLDITERKEAEEALRKSEIEAEARAEELATLMDTMPVAAYIAHDPDCRLITGNRTAHEMQRIPLGSGFSLTASENQIRSYRFLRDGRELPLNELPMRIAATGREVRNSEFTLAFADGTRCDFLGNAAPLFDKSGQLRGVIGGFIDITERKKAEEALQEREKQFKLLAENLASAVGLLDESGRFVIVNKAFRLLFGLEEQADIPNINSREWRKWQVFDEFGRLMEWDEHPVRRVALRRHGVRDQLVKVITPHRRNAKWLLVSAEPILDSSGTLKQVICVYHDVTERRRAETALIESERLAFQHEQLRALAKRLQIAREEERIRVARDLHDDIGQLLTAVKMDLAWVGKRIKRQDIEARQRLKDALMLINNGVRTVRRICSGLRPSVLDDLGIAAAIDWQAREFSSRTGVLCRLSLQAIPMALTRDEATSFFRIFQECLTNVSRHARARSVDIFLKQEKCDLVLGVKDDGIGFCPREGACSLGILGMKERAQMCGGELLIVSAPGKGTDVTLRVPISRRSREVYDADSYHR